MTQSHNLLALFAGIAAISAGCASGGAKASQFRIETLGDDLQMLRITEDVWVHVADDHTERWGNISANGLVIKGGGESLLVDTGWRVDQARRIADFATKELRAPIRRVVITHGHNDRLGGLSAFRGQGVIVYAHDLTGPQIAALDLGGLFEPVSDVRRLTVGERPVELFFPGPGHSRDNIVVWLPKEQILFGGCLVKSARSEGLGNREDAVLPAWPVSILELLDRYAAAELVIPGHGPPGGVAILQHTLGLLQQELASTSHNGHSQPSSN